MKSRSTMFIPSDAASAASDVLVAANEYNRSDRPAFVEAVIRELQEFLAGPEPGVIDDTAYFSERAKEQQRRSLMPRGKMLRGDD